VCGCDVSRRQSFSYKDGRACRHHPKASAAREFNDQQETDRLKTEREKTQTVHHRYAPPPLVPHCWLCRKEGMTLRDAYLRQLIGMSKVEIKTNITGEKINFFDMLNRSLEESGVKGQTILFTFENLTDDQKKSLKGCSYDAQLLINMTNAVVCCQHCMKKAGLKYIPPEVDMDQIIKASAIYDVLMKPVVTEIATQEIAEESKLN